MRHSCRNQRRLAVNILLIRHGMTAGNLEKRYIGTTDEPLCEFGIKQLSSCRYPQCEILVSSPMRRCLETASLLFPNQKLHVYDDFRECNFGDFEGGCYQELNGNPSYQAWIDSGGTIAFPNGEHPQNFRERCCNAFLNSVQDYADAQSIAFIVHGGTIMSILDKFAVPHHDYYDWMTENGHGWRCLFAHNIITILEKL